MLNKNGLLITVFVTIMCVNLVSGVTILQDNFVETSDTLLVDHTPDIGTWGDIWVNSSTPYVPQVKSQDYLYINATYNLIYDTGFYVCSEPISGNQYNITGVFGTEDSGDDWGTLFVRYVDSSNYIVQRFSGTSLQSDLILVKDGIEISLYQGSIDTDLGNTLVVSVVESNISVYQTGVLKHSVLNGNFTDVDTGACIGLGQYPSSSTFGQVNSFNWDSVVISSAIEQSSCTYSGSGDWEITISDNCDLSTPTDIGANKLIISGDNGKLTISSKIQAKEIHYEPDDFDGDFIIETINGGQLVAKP